jgi:decaprenyl-phosphate phosphoribosyltransferase
MRYLFLLRVHHWVKNLFLFIPAFFAGEVFQLEKFSVLVQGFFCFCFVSSAIYILNDYRDMEADKLHPIKKNRPLASGKISPVFAFTCLALLLAVGLGWAFYLKLSFLFMLLLYLLINAAYSFGLKDIPLVDVFLISFGFLIRTVSGGLLANVAVSQWLIIMVFLLSLLLAFAKRRDDLVRAGTSGKVLRKSSRYYSMEYLHICLSLISGVIMVCYMMYTFSEEVKQRLGENYLSFTSLFVFAGILRYLQITMLNQHEGSPTRIFLTDRIIQATIIGWVLTFSITLYIL